MGRLNRDLKLCLDSFSSLVQHNATRLLVISTLCLLLLCLIPKPQGSDTHISAWIQKTERVDAELNYINKYAPDGQGSSCELLIQTPFNPGHNALTVDSLKMHIKALAIATYITVDLFDQTWSLKDICFTPTVPDMEFSGTNFADIISNLMPCVIKTPLDCFWDGAKLHVSNHVTLGHVAPRLEWTTLNPKAMIEAINRAQPNSDGAFEKLIAWMSKVGIGSGYQHKPCLEPNDPKCPLTAMNKFSNQSVNIGSIITGGCKGFAANLMHWREEEIVGGLKRNKSGYITHADAIQSTILLMGEHDLYEYWRNMKKGNDISDWSITKALAIIDAWQQKFKEELSQVFNNNNQSTPAHFKMHAMTSNHLNEPLDELTNINYDTFLLSFIINTLYICLLFPKFKFQQKDSQLFISKFKTFLLSLTISVYVGLTFVSSAGICTFFGISTNMATSKLLPPISLCIGFNIFKFISQVFLRKLPTSAWKDLASDSLNEIFPIIILKSLTYIIFFGATILPLPIISIPIQATKTFALQAITHIFLLTTTALIVVPSLLIDFLSRNVSNFHRERDPRQPKTNIMSLEEQLMYRIREDLKHVHNDEPREIDISAQFVVDGLQTSFRISSNFNKPSSSVASNNISSPCQYENQTSKPFIPPDLPDVISSSVPLYKDTQKQEVTDLKSETKSEDKEVDATSINPDDIWLRILRLHPSCLTDNRLIQIMLCIISFVIIIIMLLFAPKNIYGIHLSSIMDRNSDKYEAFSIQEKQFPIYNIFMITKGIDYPSNQKLLHEFYKAVEQIDGIIKDESDDNSKFWLVAFRDWLTDLQESFDQDRNKTLITNDVWSPDISDKTKLAYKLLAQTGRLDNSVDKNIVETNRLVDNGIINVRAFYYYLSAWVSSDSFTYATTEANFKPEPSNFNDDPNILTIEKSKPLKFAQIPFIMKLPNDNDNLKTISQIRRVSQAYDNVLPNFPTGIPFIFWDQFLDLDIRFFGCLGLGILILTLLIGCITLEIFTSTIIMISTTVTSLELYKSIGYLNTPLNNILVVLLIVSLGIVTAQTVHLTIYFKLTEGDLLLRITETLRNWLEVASTELILIIIAAAIYCNSNMDFMREFGMILALLYFLSTTNTLLLTLPMLNILGSKIKVPIEHPHISNIKNNGAKCVNNKIRFVSSSKISNPQREKKRCFMRVQSEISLSTISEEPH